jgi:hypothetical protein
MWPAVRNPSLLWAPMQPLCRVPATLELRPLETHITCFGPWILFCPQIAVFCLVPLHLKTQREHWASGAASRRSAPESWMTLPSRNSLLLTDNLQEETINLCRFCVPKPMECSDRVYVGEHYEVCVYYGNLLFMEMWCGCVRWTECV